MPSIVVSNPVIEESIRIEVISSLVDQAATNSATTDESGGLILYVSSTQNEFLNDIDLVNRQIDKSRLFKSFAVAYAVDESRLIDFSLEKACRLLFIEDRKNVLVVATGSTHTIAFQAKQGEEHEAHQVLDSKWNLSNFIEAVESKENKTVNLNISDFTFDQKFVNLGNGTLSLPETDNVVIHKITTLEENQNPIEELAPDIIPDDTILTLSMMGCKMYRRTEKTHDQLVQDVIQKMVEESELEPKEITRLILSSHTYLDYDENAIKKILERMNCKATIELVYMSRCASAVSAVRAGTNYILGNRNEKVLVVLVDKVLENVSSRVLNNGLSIFSDGATGFVLSNNSSGYSVMSICESVDNSGAYPELQSNFMNYLKMFGAGIKAIAEKSKELLNVESESLKYLITGNYNFSIMKNYGILFGCKTNQLFTKELGENAHLFSADIINNIESIRKADLIKDGESLMLLGTGSFHWGLLQVVYKN